MRRLPPGCQTEAGEHKDALPARKPGADGCFPPGSRIGAGESDETLSARNPESRRMFSAAGVPNRSGGVR